MSILDPEYILYAFLVFVRIGGLITAAPFFEQNFIPKKIKLLLAVSIAYIMVGLVPHPKGLPVTQPVALAYYVVIELLTGVVIGFSARFVFFAIRFAGEFIGFQMAISISQVISPADGQSSNPISNMLMMTFTLVFLLLDGHHHLFRAIVLSYEAIPLAGAALANPGNLMLSWTGELFVIAIRLASPFMITIFLVDMTLGIFARVAPQTEIFSMSLSLKLVVGTFLLLLYIQNFFPVLPELIDRMGEDLLQMIEALAPI